MNNIEVEVRSFITKEKFEELLGFFDKKAKFLMEDYQETYYFDGKEDLRIQRNNFFSKIWLKKGKLHDDWREEFEIRFAKEDFEKLEILFLSLGFKVKIKWFRNRRDYEWNNIKVSLDYTKGYGHILELERLCSENEKELAFKELNKKFEELKIALSPKEEFEKKFKHYEQNWESLTKSF